MRFCNTAALVFSLVLPLSAFATPINVSTGSNVTGGLDNLYTVVYNGGYAAANTTPRSGGSNAYSISRNPAWVAPATGSTWIGPDAGSANSSTDAGGYYTYTTTFTLARSYGDELSGSFAADNAATIYLNGVNTGITTYTFSQLSSFDITSGFVAGVNTLQFVVENGNGTTDTTGPTGLDVTGSISSTPEPSSLALLGTGVVSMIGAGRRKLMKR